MERKGHTMRFINCNAGEFPLLVYRLQMPSEGFCKAELGRDVKEAGARVATAEVLHDDIAVRSWGLGVYGRNGDIGGLEGVDLVLHEGEEGGNDDGDAMVNYGGELEAEAFAERGGGLDEDIAAVEGGGDNLALVGPMGG